MDKIAINVSEAAKRLGVSRPKMYEIMRRDDFPAVRMGGRILISQRGLDEWLYNLATHKPTEIGGTER